MVRVKAVSAKVTGAPANGRPDAPADKVIIVGTPNVGKSALFNRLTGRYVTVSNYPGTTVEISSGRSRLLGDGIEVIDTPGMYSLLPVSEEECVARNILFETRPKAVLHVIDAKNIGRMLSLTLLLAQTDLPIVLVLNMADEAEQLGIRIDRARLEHMLGLPVVMTVATTGRGVKELIEAIGGLDASRARVELRFDDILETAISDIAGRLSRRKMMSGRIRAILLLQEDAEEKRHLLAEKGQQEAEEVMRIVRQTCNALGHFPHYDLAMAVKTRVDALLAETARFPSEPRAGFREELSEFCMNPWTGIPLLILVLFFGVYMFVGKFGAGVCVAFLENRVFGQYVNPWVNRVSQAVVPWPQLAELFVGDYGIITLGLRYAVAIILPVVGTFFIAFSILEDSGYLPRLAMLIDRVFKKIGLNGRAVIPMVLGFGCDTMATMVTRTLETRRERIIATVLLALAIPCSAQMGLILALLAARPYALLVWAAVVTGIFLTVGMLAARIMPGDRASFYMELPPLRLPRAGNVLVKTYTRVAWYFREIVPMFIIASALIWLGRATGLFEVLISALQPVMRSLGLPGQSAVVFLFGFFRRDYGAAGLYDLDKQGLLSGNQLAVAAVTLTLFLPCIAQFLVMKKERGWKATLLTSAFICAVAFLAGFAVNAGLGLLRIQL